MHHAQPSHVFIIQNKERKRDRPHAHTHTQARVPAPSSCAHMFILKPKWLHANAEIKRTLSYARSKFSVPRRHTHSQKQKKQQRASTDAHTHTHSWCTYLPGHSGRYEYAHAHASACARASAHSRTLTALQQYPLLFSPTAPSCIFFPPPFPLLCLIFQCFCFFKQLLRCFPNTSLLFVTHNNIYIKKKHKHHIPVRFLFSSNNLVSRPASDFPGLINSCRLDHERVARKGFRLIVPDFLFCFVLFCSAARSAPNSRMVKLCHFCLSFPSAKLWTNTSTSS